MRITPVSPSIRQFVVVLNVVVVRAIHMYVYPLKSLRLPMVTYHFPHPIPDSIHLYTTMIPLIDIGIDLCSLCNCYPNPWYPLFVSFFFFFYFYGVICVPFFATDMPSELHHRFALGYCFYTL